MCNRGYTSLERVERSEWVMLVYRLPREPSTPRITLWRKLRRLGVASVVDGVVGLPLDSRNREQLEWLADEVVESGGEATIWIATPSTAAHERSLAVAMSERIAAEYRSIISDSERALARASRSGGGRWRGSGASCAGSPPATTSRRRTETGLARLSSDWPRTWWRWPDEVGDPPSLSCRSHSLRVADRRSHLHEAAR